MKLKEITFAVDNMKSTHTTKKENLTIAIKTLLSMVSNGYDIRILTIKTI